MLKEEKLNRGFTIYRSSWRSRSSEDKHIQNFESADKVGRKFSTEKLGLRERISFCVY
jgi:hypothetical protein